MVYVLARSEIQQKPERTTLPQRSEELLPEGRVFAGKTILLCTSTTVNKGIACGGIMNYNSVHLTHPM